jgi:hypothetical protein
MDNSRSDSNQITSMKKRNPNPKRETPTLREKPDPNKINLLCIRLMSPNEGQNNLQSIAGLHTSA